VPELHRKKCAKKGLFRLTRSVIARWIQSLERGDFGLLVPRFRGSGVPRLGSRFRFFLRARGIRRGFQMPDQAIHRGKRALDVVLFHRQFVFGQETLIAGVDEVVKDFLFGAMRNPHESSEFLVTKTAETLGDIRGRGTSGVTKLPAEFVVALHVGPPKQRVDASPDLLRTLPRDDLSEVLPSSHGPRKKQSRFPVRTYAFPNKSDFCVRTRFRNCGVKRSKASQILRNRTREPRTQPRNPRNPGTSEPASELRPYLPQIRKDRRHQRGGEILRPR